MRKILFVLGLMLNCIIYAQQIVTYPNPTFVPDLFGFADNPIVYNNALYFQYSISNADNRLAKFDGTNVSIYSNINSLDTGYSFYHYPIVFNNNLYFGYKNSFGKIQLAKCDGTNITLYPNPNSNDFGLIPKDNAPFVPYYSDTIFVIHNGNLFFKYKDSTSIIHIAKFDGSTISVIPNVNSTHFGVCSKMVSYKGYLYFNYAINSTKFQLAKYNDTSISLVPLISSNDYGAVDDPFIFNNNLYIGYKDISRTNLAKLNNDSLFKINNIRTQDLGYNGNPYVYGNKLLFSYYGLNNTECLAEFNDASIKIITNNINDYKLRRPKIVYNGEFYFHAFNPSNNFRSNLYRYNGTNLTIIPNYNNNDDEGVGLFNSGNMIVYNNKLYIGYFKKDVSLLCSYSTGSAGFDSIPGKICKQFLAGYLANPIIFRDSLYFGYYDGCNGMELAKLSFPKPLPLHLLSFSAQQQQSKVLLNWQTANEVNVSHINIQHSSNGKDFTTIGKLNASCCEYTFTDDLITKDQQLKTIYYRLEIVDKDGSKTYSEVKTIRLNHSNHSIGIYPNPAKSIVNIECANAKEIMVIDYLGRIINQQKTNSQLSILHSPFNKGVYIIKATLNNGETVTEKLVVE